MRTTSVRLSIWILPLIVAAAIASTCLFLPFAGGFHDDGIYLTSAKALAEGDGYVIQSLPQEIPQTKYPILFPALLSLVWLVWPVFPDNVVLIRLIPFSAAIAWGWVLWHLVAVAWQRPEDARWLVPLTMTTPIVSYFSLMPLSETLFGFLGTCSILVLWKAAHKPQGEGILQAALAAILCALAFHTRTIGISLLACAAVAFPPWRRLKQGVIFGSIWIGLCAPWWIWQRINDAPVESVLAYYTKDNYTGWNTINGSGLPSALEIAAQNAIAIAGSPLIFWDLPVNPGTVWLCLLLTLLAGTGLFLQMFRRESMSAIWVLGTVAIALLWPWPPGRFLVPVLPFALLAVRDSVSPALWRRTGPILAAAGVAYGLFMSGSLAAESREAGSIRGRLGDRDLTWTDHQQAYDWIRTQTAPSAIVSGNLDPNYWLYAQRKAVRGFAADPERLFYAEASPAGALGPPERLLHHLTAMHADYLVLERMSLFQETEPFGQQIEELRARHPSLLNSVFESTSGRITVYRVDRREVAEVR